MPNVERKDNCNDALITAYGLLIRINVAAPNNELIGSDCRFNSLPVRIASIIMPALVTDFVKPVNAIKNSTKTIDITVDSCLLFFTVFSKNVFIVDVHNVR